MLCDQLRWQRLLEPSHPCQASPVTSSDSRWSNCLHDSWSPDHQREGCDKQEGTSQTLRILIRVWNSLKTRDWARNLCKVEDKRRTGRSDSFPLPCIQKEEGGMIGMSLQVEEKEYERQQLIFVEQGMRRSGRKRKGEEGKTRCYVRRETFAPAGGKWVKAVMHKIDLEKKKKEKNQGGSRESYSNATGNWTTSSKRRREEVDSTQREKKVYKLVQVDAVSQSRSLQSEWLWLTRLTDADSLFANHCEIAI